MKDTRGAVVDTSLRQAFRQQIDSLLQF